jgi:hypothetical protein
MHMLLPKYSPYNQKDFIEDIMPEGHIRILAQSGILGLT